ncbi:hypothetical protein [Rheinheimera salexigens]|uniref:Alpha/beta hydrolase n=1 Tax=Rheinheimera salexigens TaxID=1628148 RepID=A0A1E7Q3N9_9GAMM|nr:hypothetical protein [Rheinheimera salexigens]OEY68767.1 hypothetical protein BI198_03685 [Rheinheimera salexigens]
MFKLLHVICLLCLVTLLTSCSSARFFQQQEPNVRVKKALVAGQLPNFHDLTTNEVHQHCLSLTKDTDIGLVLLVHCSNELLSRADLSQPLRQYALTSYNQTLYLLIKMTKQPSFTTDSVNVQYANPSQFSFSQQIASPSPIDKAVIIGHSMGGVVAKLLATETHLGLWDAALNQSPDAVLTVDNAALKDIFIFEPAFKDNTVFS